MFVVPDELNFQDNTQNDPYIEALIGTDKQILKKGEMSVHRSYIVYT